MIDEIKERDYFATTYTSCDMKKGEALLWERCLVLNRTLIHGCEIEGLYRAIYYASMKIRRDNKRLAYPRLDLSWNRETTKTPCIDIGGSSILFTPVERHYSEEMISGFEDSKI